MQIEWVHFEAAQVRGPGFMQKYVFGCVFEELQAVVITKVEPPHWQFKQTHKGRISWDESCWAHVLDGFQGNVLEVDASGQVPNVFNAWKVIISLMGNMIAGTNALGDNMLANKKTRQASTWGPS